MALIKIVPPDKAQGAAKEAYSIFDDLGWVPRPFQIFSPCDYLVTQRAQHIRHNMNHPTLSGGLMALIRMCIAEAKGFAYCISFNSKLLQMMGIANDDQLGRILADPSQAPLGEKDKAMLLLVIKAALTPEQVNQADIQNLRDLGWSESDIVEAVAHGADMLYLGTMFAAFKMGQE